MYTFLYTNRTQQESKIDTSYSSKCAVLSPKIHRPKKLSNVSQDSYTGQGQYENKVYHKCVHQNYTIRFFSPMIIQGLSLVRARASDRHAQSKISIYLKVIAVENAFQKQII